MKPSAEEKITVIHWAPNHKNGVDRPAPDQGVVEYVYPDWGREHFRYHHTDQSGREVWQAEDGETLIFASTQTAA